LPSSRDEPDPVHDRRLIELLERSEVQDRALVMEVYKQALQSLRSIRSPDLRSGRNDFTEAARGAALFCVRMATIEVVAEKPGFWVGALNLYAKGHWPCGLMPGRELVVY
jgi:hypothetical protein